MQKHDKRLLFFLILPFFAFIFMIGQGIYQASGTRFALPIQGYDPRDLLYGRYVNVRVHADLLNNIKGQCGCIRPSASVEKVGYRNAISYLSCVEAKQSGCIAIIDGSNPRHIKGLSEPVRMYVEETVAINLDTILRQQPQRLEIEATLNTDGFQFHGLYLDGKPIKTLSGSN
jgi:GDYXXLXY protein